MIAFDPVREAALVDQEGCSASLLRSLTLDYARSVNGVGNFANGCLKSAVHAYLCGRADVGDPLLRKASEWIALAIAENEPASGYAEYFTEAQRFKTQALCNWLLKSVQDDASYGELVKYDDLNLSRKRMKKSEVAMTLYDYVDAGTYGRCLELAEAAGIDRPKSLKSVRDEGKMSVACALARSGRQFEAELDAGLQAFLSNNVDEWLGRGYYSLAAQWLKVAYWNGDPGAPSAREVLLRAYDHLPGRTLPLG